MCGKSYILTTFVLIISINVHVYAIPLHEGNNGVLTYIFPVSVLHDMM